MQEDNGRLDARVSAGSCPQSNRLRRRTVKRWLQLGSCPAPADAGPRHAARLAVLWRHMLRSYLERTRFLKSHRKSWFGPVDNPARLTISFHSADHIDLIPSRDQLPARPHVGGRLTGRESAQSRLPLVFYTGAGAPSNTRSYSGYKRYLVRTDLPPVTSIRDRAGTTWASARACPGAAIVRSHLRCLGTALRRRSAFFWLARPCAAQGRLAPTAQNNSQGGIAIIYLPAKNGKRVTRHG